MKKALLTFGKFVLFLLVFLAGSLLNPFHLRWMVTHPTPTSTRFFVPDGLLLMLGLYVLILVVEVVRKRLVSSGPWTTLALVLALVLGYLARFGFATHDLF
jgi:hypothetical protein